MFCVRVPILLFILEIFEEPDQVAGHQGLHLVVEMQLSQLLRLVPLIVPAHHKQTENDNHAESGPLNLPIPTIKLS